MILRLVGLIVLTNKKINIINHNGFVQERLFKRQKMEASLYKALMNDTKEYYIPASKYPYQNALSL